MSTKRVRSDARRSRATPKDPDRDNTRAKLGRAEVGPFPFDEFHKIMKSRLQSGFLSYGDGSFDRKVTSLLDEIEQELLDVVGWSYILWSRIHHAKRWAKKDLL